MYPIGENGQPLYLLAQIIFGEQEMLQFFISDDDLYGLDFDDQTNQTGFRVVFHENIDRSITIDSLRERGVPSSSEADSFALLPMMHSVGKMHMEQGFDSLSESLPLHEKILRTELQNFFGISSKLDYETEEKIWEELNTEGSKLFGLPFFTQDDPRDKNGTYQDEDFGVLLLQIDSMNEINLLWGDGGVCNFFINQEDLENRDFSRVLYNWDCY